MRGEKMMSKTLHEIVGENVKRYRKELGMTQANLSYLMGWNSSAAPISMIENGKRGISLLTVEKLAESLGISAIDLVEDWS